MQIYYICQIYVDRFTSYQHKNDPIGPCILSNIFTSELLNEWMNEWRKLVTRFFDICLFVCLSVCLSYHMPFVHTELERRRKFTFYEKLLLTLRNNGVILSSIAQRSKSREQKCRNSFFFAHISEKWIDLHQAHIKMVFGRFYIYFCLRNGYFCDICLF